jgi:3-methyladenine DNA glycosylase AlkD
MTAKQVIAELRRHRASSHDLAGMARFGINTTGRYGVSIPTLRRLGKQLGVNHELAIELWATGVGDARILAALIAEPSRMTRRLADQWVGQVDSWDLCDQLCSNLFRKTSFAHDKIAIWARRQHEWTRRAGFVLIACLAVHDRDAVDRAFVDYLRLIETYADDERNYVKKAVSWALRQIGKRNDALRAAALGCCQRLVSLESKSARWIARDALRELQARD